jgi:ketosteroid isomerase-like protein
MEVPMNTDTATSSDLDSLTALNRDYIHSVQHGDVQRFDEILAEDFLCSLVDKKQFLAQTARPVTISGLSVQEVRVRILGDVAIIHARTSYTTADGEQRNGPYTDVWARRAMARGLPLRQPLAVQAGSAARRVSP